MPSDQGRNSFLSVTTMLLLYLSSHRPVASVRELFKGLSETLKSSRVASAASTIARAASIRFRRSPVSPTLSPVRPPGARTCGSRPA